MFAFIKLTGTAENPAPSMAPLQPVFIPEVISVKPDVAELYNQGFKNPRAALPEAIRSLFKSWTRLANVGVAQLVPSTASADPADIMMKFVAWAATSGYARPELLKYWLTLKCVWSFVSQLVTAVS